MLGWTTQECPKLTATLCLNLWRRITVTSKEFITLFHMVITWQETILAFVPFGRLTQPSSADWFHYGRVTWPRSCDTSCRWTCGSSWSTPRFTADFVRRIYIYIYIASFRNSSIEYQTFLDRNAIIASRCGFQLKLLKCIIIYSRRNLAKRATVRDRGRLRCFVQQRIICMFVERYFYKGYILLYK